MAEATGLTENQIQHYTRKNVVRTKTGKGRGHRYEFSISDIIRFLMIGEMMRFGLDHQKMYILIYHFFKKILPLNGVQEYLKAKLFLEAKHFILTCEFPKEGKHEEVFGYLIYKPNNPWPKCYFHQPGPDEEPGFYGFKFEEFSRSVLLIDMADIYRVQHNFLEKHPEFKEDNRREQSDEKTKLKG
jgi:DNA-binding transcriptional MerR regulator